MRRKEEKRNNLKALFNLYLNYILNKKTLIAILLSLIFLSTILFFISRIEDVTDYLINPLRYHQSYFNLALLIINMLNGIIIAFLVLNLSINSLSFDVLFIPYVKRMKLSIIKLIVIFVILFILLTFEFSIIMLIALINFKNYKITNELTLSFYYNYISLIFEALVSIGLTEIFNIIITPLFIVFAFMVIRILMNNFNNIKDILFDYIPYLIYNSKKNIFEFGNSLISIALIVAMIILYVEIYSIKDIKWKHFSF